MTGSLTATLAAPIREVEALLGPGFSGSSPAAALHTARANLDGVAAAADNAWQWARTQWTGSAAESAGQFAGVTIAEIESIATAAGQLGVRTEQAEAAVARVRERVRAILQTFEVRAAALESALQTPQDAAELVDEAHRALGEAISLVEELRTELAGHAEAVTTAAAAPPPTSGSVNSGSGWNASSFSPAGSGAGSGAAMSSGGLGSGAWGSGVGQLSGLAAPAAQAIQAAAKSHRQQDPGKFGAGEAITLPDGSTADAPNKVAADAVRHALTQLGVPYVWGGTAPGIGLDCSGLTQWAYRQAGLDLPRLAQEQDIGSAVGRSGLRPGDLAVWDGHVAMVVGHGLMIEAGDPVQLSPIRTTNLNQGFHGFFRPTA